MCVFVLDQRKQSADALLRATSASAPLAQTSGGPSRVAVHDPAQGSKARGKPVAASQLEA